MGLGSFRKSGAPGGIDPQALLSTGGQEIRIFWGGRSALLRDGHFFGHPAGQLPGVARLPQSRIRDLEFRLVLSNLFFPVS